MPPFYRTCRTVSLSFLIVSFQDSLEEPVKILKVGRFLHVELHVDRLTGIKVNEVCFRGMSSSGWGIGGILTEILLSR